MSAVAHIKDYKTGKFYRDEFRGGISWNGFEHNVLLRNEGVDANGQIRFNDVAMATGADDIKDARGMATADFDNDGDLDIVINNNPGDSGRTELARATLLKNNVGATRNWLAVELRGSASNRDAVGALVTVEAGGRKHVRLVGAGSGFASQHTQRLYFGLGDDAQVSAITIRWPNGQTQRFERIGEKPIETKRLLRVTEGGGLDAQNLPAMRHTGAGAQLIAAK